MRRQAARGQMAGERSWHGLCQGIQEQAGPLAPPCSRAREERRQGQGGNGGGEGGGDWDKERDGNWDSSRREDRV